MKPRMRYWRARWWCMHDGLVGVGATMEEAWNDLTRESPFSKALWGRAIYNAYASTSTIKIWSE